MKPEEYNKYVLCGQDRGRRVYHVENYFPERIVENSIPMCITCHEKYHQVKPENPEEFRQYLESVREIPFKPRYNKIYWPPKKDKVLDSYN